jgi:hypothetical protein
MASKKITERDVIKAIDDLGGTPEEVLGNLASNGFWYGRYVSSGNPDRSTMCIVQQYFHHRFGDDVRMRGWSAVEIKRKGQSDIRVPLGEVIMKVSYWNDDLRGTVLPPWEDNG